MSITLPAKEGRFARLEAIEWWDQARLARARVLVIGAGALGNEVIKNLALLGVGHVVVADMDHVELSNLSRSVLFREADEGRSKADCAARAAREIFGGMHITPLNGNVLAELGLGWFRWAEVVIGALDNREARVFVNSACARVGRPWFDGGIEVLHGIVRGFAPPATACYECTMSKVDWDLLNKRRSCSLLARRAIANRGTPTTPTTASIIAAMQVQEVVKQLHGRPTLLGRGFVFDGAEHTSYAVNYPVSPDCPWHEEQPVIESAPWFGSATPLRAVWAEAARRLGGLDAIDFARELVERLDCPACAHREAVLLPAEKVSAERLRCVRCQGECAPTFLHSLTADSPLLDLTPREIGLPAWDVVWARRGAEMLGFEMSGDNPFASAPSVPSPA
jgi:molybdopterin/thiamine biosynthesis adenylyltransferase